MATIKKDINKNESLIEQLQLERERIQEEKRQISDRIEKIRNEGRKELNPELKSFSLEEIEKNAVNSNYEVIVKKLERLENALKQDDLVDGKYRSLVAEYINDIEPKIHELQSKRDKLIEESLEVIKQAEVKSEELKKQAELITEEIDDLIDPTGETVFSYYTNYSGPYILTKIKNKINGYNKER